MSSLGNIGLSMPFSPDFEWGEHSSFSTHVTEGSLTSSGCTRSRDSWDSCYGSTSSPRLSGVLGTSFIEDGVTLSSVLGKLRVNEVDKIISNWGHEDAGHWDASGNFLGVIALVNGDNWS